MRFADLAVGPSPQLPLAVHERRRQELAASLGHGHVAVIATHVPKTYANDVEYPYRPDSDFWYLTGFDEPHATLVLHGGTGACELFLQPRKATEEIWTGRRLGAARAPEALGIDKAFDADELNTRLPALVGSSKVHLLAADDARTARRVKRAAGDHLVKAPHDGRPGGPSKKPKPQDGPVHARQHLHEMRLVKDKEELRLIRKACDLGVEAHEHVQATIRPGAKEYHVEADFAHHARRHGSNGVGYPSICGCGENAAVLHYVRNRDGMKAGEMFLLDAGCEWGWYTSDITRTYPVGGEFTGRQMEIYEVVLQAQRKAMDAIRPGALFSSIHDTAVDAVADGLVDLGLLDMDKETAVQTEAYKRFFMHGTSHWLGLDVHDAGARQEPDGSPRRLKEGMVLTVEPGLYFNKDFTDCPTETTGIGIRIEDDIAVTGSGRSNLTRGLAVDPSAVADAVRRG